MRKTTCSSASSSGTLSGPTSAKRHAHVLRLSARVSAEQMRITKQSRAGITVECLGHPRVRVGVIAQRPELFLAEKAVAAGDRKRNDDAIAALEIGHSLADLFHDPHELVAQDVAGFHRGDASAIEMQVRSANAGGRDANDRIAGIDQLGVGNAFDANILCSAPTDSLHRRLPFAQRRHCPVG